MLHLYDIDFLNLVYGFLGILWQSFYLLLAKELKDLCFLSDKNITQPVQYTAWFEIL